MATDTYCLHHQGLVLVTETDSQTERQTPGRETVWGEEGLSEKKKFSACGDRPERVAVEVGEGRGGR